MPARAPLSRLMLPLSMLLVLAFGAGTLGARDIGPDEALQLRQSGKLKPLDALLAGIHARYPAARVLEIELEEDDGRLVYEFELLTREGQVRELELDAATGTLLRDEAED